MWGYRNGAAVALRLEGIERMSKQCPLWPYVCPRAKAQGEHYRATCSDRDLAKAIKAAPKLIAHWEGTERGERAKAIHALDKAEWQRRMDAKALVK